MKKFLCILLAAVMAVSFAGCAKPTAAKRFNTQCYELTGRSYAENSVVLPVSDGKLLVCSEGTSSAELFIIDVKTEKTDRYSFKYEKGYRYELIPEVYANGNFVFEAHSEEEYANAASRQEPSFFMIGTCGSKKLRKVSVPNGNGVFSYDCANFYFIFENEVYCRDVASGDEKLLAKFPLGSELYFDKRVDESGRFYNLHVNPEGGDSYLCRIELANGSITNPVYQSYMSYNAGVINGHTAMLMYPDYEDVLSLQLYLINFEKDKAGTDTKSIDLGEAFRTADYVPDFGYGRVWGDEENGQLFAFVSDSTLDNGEAQPIFMLGRIGAEMAEFADIGLFGKLGGIDSGCYFKVVDEDTGAVMHLVAAILDGKLCIINPDLLDYTVKALIVAEPYVNIKPL